MKINLLTNIIEEAWLVNCTNSVAASQTAELEQSNILARVLKTQQIEKIKLLEVGNQASYSNAFFTHLRLLFVFEKFRSDDLPFIFYFFLVKIKNKRSPLGVTVPAHQSQGQVFQ